MRASRETARAARLQLGQANDLTADLDTLDRQAVRERLESMRRLYRDVRSFIESAERVLPAERDYAAKAAKREAQPVA